MNMRKSYYYVVAAMFMTMSFSGCSSEEDDIDDKEGICLSFRLLNERVVQSGVNKNGADLFLPSSDDNIIFCVYDKDGKMIGVPYSGMFCNFSLQTWMTIDSHSTYHLRCKWKETGKYDDVTYPLCGCSDLPDLPLGEYQVSFSIEYRKKANGPKSKFHTAAFNYKFTVE